MWTDTKAQTPPPGYESEFNLIIDVNELGDGFYHIHFDIGYGLVQWDGCFIPLHLSFDVYDGDPADIPNATLLYTYQLTSGNENYFRFYGNDNQGAYHEWFPETGVFDYVLTYPASTCSGSTFNPSDADFMVISSHVNNCNITPAGYEINYNVLSTVLDASTGVPITEFLGSAGSIEAYTEFQAIVTSLDLPDDPTLKLLEANGDPVFRWNECFEPLTLEHSYFIFRYAVPYGGCPPYEKQWVNDLGAVLPPYIVDSSHPDNDAYTPLVGNDRPWGLYSSSVLHFEAPNLSYGTYGDYYNLHIEDNSVPAQGFDLPVGALVKDVSVMRDNSKDCGALVELDMDGPMLPASWWYGSSDGLTEASQSGNPNPIYEVSEAGDYTFYIDEPPGTSCYNIYGGPYPYYATVTIEDLVDIDLPDGHVVSGAETWNTDRTVMDVVEVSPGSVLTISGGAEIQFMDENSGILIQPGGKLIVNNAVLRGRGCSPTNWRGVRVAGDNSQPHPDPATFNPETDLSPHHGIAYLKNGSAVRDAKIGVSSGDGDGYTVLGPLPQPNFGGIIVAENTTFENNETGLFFAMFTGSAGNDISSVKDCQFLFSDTYAGTYDTGLGLPLPMGIATFACMHSQAFTGNRFQNFLTGLPVEEQGVGILNIFSPMQVGVEDVASKGNHFVNLFEGIVNGSSLSLLGQLRVFENTFDGVQKGITVMSGEATVVAGNTFTNVEGGVPDNSAFGLYAEGCNNLDIHGNTFDCSGPGFMNNSGVIIRNSGSEQDSRLSGNVFTGNFGIASRFEGKNARLIVDCNQYSNPIFWDWAIIAIETGDYLADQGVCVDLEPELSRRNVFHEVPDSPTTPNNYNIFNATGIELQYRAQSADFLPDLVFGAVNAYPCAYPPGTVLTDQCVEEGGTGGGDPGIIHGRIAASSDEEEKTALYSQLLHARLDQGQIEQAKGDMLEQGRPISDKILAATYIDEQKTDSVLAILGQLPLNTAADAAFHALCMERLNGIVPPAGPGKTMGAQERLLRETAAETANPASTYAESLIAAHFMERHPKNPLAVDLPLVQREAADMMQIYPNPANNLLRISTDGVDFDEIRVVTLDGLPIRSIIADKSKRVYEMDVSGLPSGIYFCKLVAGGRVVEAKKIIVIR